jgi:hypothetical protein
MYAHTVMIIFLKWARYILKYDYIYVNIYKKLFHFKYQNRVRIFITVNCNSFRVFFLIDNFIIDCMIHCADFSIAANCIRFFPCF